MQLLDIQEAGANLVHTWPDGNREEYPQWIAYRAVAPDGQHLLRIGFGTRTAYGRARKRVVVWIDGHPHAEFVGADDFDRSGEVLVELKVPGDRGERLCRYPEEAIPERYAAFTIAGLTTRIVGPGVHNAWAIVANVGDHRISCAVAALRRLERIRPLT